jgi:GTPase SAR1 family protein
MAEVEYVFKVLVLGDHSVGKSSLIRRFHDNEFDKTLCTTVGVDFFIHDLELDGKKIKVSFY